MVGWKHWGEGVRRDPAGAGFGDAKVCPFPDSLGWPSDAARREGAVFGGVLVRCAEQAGGRGDD